MRILIASVSNVDSPEITLINSLLGCGAEVAVCGYGLGALPDSIRESASVELFDFGKRLNRLAQIPQFFKTRAALRALLDSRGAGFDAIWTTDEAVVRDMGARLLGYRHIMQMYELCEYVPALFRSPMPFHSKATVEICRRAHAVVVPEYNRACIIKTWWNLPNDPVVLPNKPHGLSLPSARAVERARELFRGERRKVLLYQGIFTPERQLEAFASCLKYLDDEYALYLMGAARSSWQIDYVNKLLRIDDRVHYIGFEPSPDHLAYTQYGHIGVLVYVPQRVGYVSPLNGLYCAPNKIWEYAAEGLPMISNNLPGLRQVFESNEMGLVSPLDPESLALAVRKIDDSYERYSSNARSYYDSVDVDEIIAGIIES